ncbi:MAG: T9SS type A sorting domain-containing protein [Candidatus Neomarinimicrobiota bacterium]
MIFELQRGPLAYYILTGTIEHTGYHLRVYAEEGDGDRPKLVPAVLTGGFSVKCFQAWADLTLKGLYATNVDQGNVMDDKNIVKISGKYIRVVIDDCHLHGDRQSFVRLDADSQRVFITNSILSYCVLNGRGIDNRSNLVDTLVVENCTFYNLISKVHRDEGGKYINYLKFNHNTFYNIGEEFMGIGEVVTFLFTNNLVVNAGFLGRASTTTDPDYIFDLMDTLSTPEIKHLTQTIEFRSNNFYMDPAIVDLWGNLKDTTLVAVDFTDSLGYTLIDTTDIIHDPVTFTKVPSLDTTLNIIRVVWEEYGGEEDYQPPFDNGDVGKFGEEGFGTCPFDFSYPTTTQSYRYADGNFPLGDLNWFPELKELWDAGGTVAAGHADRTVPAEFSLAQNYPNPFNPATAIRYELSHASGVRLMVYNLLGQEVARLVDTNQEAGSYKVMWDGKDARGNLVGSGVYLYRIETDNFVQIRKMVLLK